MAEDAEKDACSDDGFEVLNPEGDEFKYLSGDDLTNAKTIMFLNLKEEYDNIGQVHCVYFRPEGWSEQPQDEIALFEPGWVTVDQAVAKLPVDLSVRGDAPLGHLTFEGLADASFLKDAYLEVAGSVTLFQLCYLRGNEVLGASTPFSVRGLKAVDVVPSLLNSRHGYQFIDNGTSLFGMSNVDVSVDSLNESIVKLDPLTVQIQSQKIDQEKTSVDADMFAALVSELKKSIDHLTVTIAESSVTSSSSSGSSDILKERFRSSTDLLTASLKDCSRAFDQCTSAIKLQTLPSSLPLRGNIVTDSVKRVDVAESVNQADAAEPVNQADAAEPVKQADVAEPVKQADVAEPVKQADVVEPVKQADLVKPVEQPAGKTSSQDDINISDKDKEALTEFLLLKNGIAGATKQFEVLSAEIKSRIGAEGCLIPGMISPRAKDHTSLKAHDLDAYTAAEVRELKFLASQAEHHKSARYFEALRAGRSFQDNRQEIFQSVAENLTLKSDASETPIFSGACVEKTSLQADVAEPIIRADVAQPVNQANVAKPVEHPASKTSSLDAVNIPDKDKEALAEIFQFKHGINDAVSHLQTLAAEISSRADVDASATELSVIAEMLKSQAVVNNHPLKDSVAWLFKMLAGQMHLQADSLRTSKHLGAIAASESGDSFRPRAFQYFPETFPLLCSSRAENTSVQADVADPGKQREKILKADFVEPVKQDVYAGFTKRVDATLTTNRDLEQAELERRLKETEAKLAMVQDKLIQREKRHCDYVYETERSKLLSQEQIDKLLRELTTLSENMKLSEEVGEAFKLKLDQASCDVKNKEQEIESLKSQCAELEESRAIVLSDNTRLQNALTENQDEIESLKSQCTELEESRDIVLSDNARLQNALSESREQLRNRESNANSDVDVQKDLLVQEFMKKSEEVEVIKQQLEHIKAELSQSNALRASLQNELSQLRQKSTESNSSAEGTSAGRLGAFYRGFSKLTGIETETRGGMKENASSSDLEEDQHKQILIQELLKKSEELEVIKQQLARANEELSRTKRLSQAGQSKNPSASSSAKPNQSEQVVQSVIEALDEAINEKKKVEKDLEAEKKRVQALEERLEMGAEKYRNLYVEMLNLREAMKILHHDA